jgi:hypothetical protein
VIAMCFYLILCVGIYIIIRAALCDTVDWAGICLFLVGLSGFLGAALTGKWLQKKEEIKSKEMPE